jgi:hypothetical protein
MSASTEELIAINSLLIEREAVFARVHTLESRMSCLLGEPYPFEAPAVTLPSSIKKMASKSKKAAKQKAPLKPRRLNDNEVAYRLSWRDKGQAVAQELTDLRSIVALFQESLPGMKLLQIETIDLNGAVIEQLFPE